MLTSGKKRLSAPSPLWRALLGLALLVICLSPLTVLAHEEVTVGSYTFEIGWINEPVMVGERNGLALFISSAAGTGEHDHAASSDQHGETGVTGAEATLQFTVEYGGVRKTYPLRPIADHPGQYTADILPLREGQYTFIFSGSLKGEPVDLKFEPEEVEPLGNLAFPETPPSGAQLAAQFATLQAQARTNQMMALGGIVLGLVGVGLGAYSLVKK